ncbi:MAG TPA: hypothetical protein VF867_14130 [Arthrobacter sp.]
MKRPVIALSAVAVLTLTGCAQTMNTAQSCSEYNTLQKLWLHSSGDTALQAKYISQMKTLIEKAPDTVKVDMHSIYLLESNSPEAKSNPEAARRIDVACAAAK